MGMILLIEDDLIDQMAFTRMLHLKGLNYDCNAAMSVKEARNMLASKKFDLIISDYNLADGTTFDLLDDIANTPFIVITGNEDEATKAAVLQNGALACFTKDLNLNYLEELPPIIQKAIEQLSSAGSPTNHTSSTYFSNNKKKTILQEGAITINLSRLKEIFDDNTQVLKESIELFLTYKPRELEELRKAIFIQHDCEEVCKITHKMKSGFRIFGMKGQEQLASAIQKKATFSDQQCEGVQDIFNQLSKDTQTAIQLLKKELPLL